MYIAGIYSFNHGEETIKELHRAELEEVLQVIETVDAESCKTRAGKGKTMEHELLYNPPCLNEAFERRFSSKEWAHFAVIAEYSSAYYVPGYVPRSKDERDLLPSRHLDFVKGNLGLEVQFGEIASAVYDICAKLTIFARLEVINCGIQIVPVKAFAEQMSPEVSCFEQFVWDLEHRGVSDIDIPVLIIGIDTDGVRPKDLKIAEARQPYLLLED